MKKFLTILSFCTIFNTNTATPKHLTAEAIKEKQVTTLFKLLEENQSINSQSNFTVNSVREAYERGTILQYFTRNGRNEAPTNYNPKATIDDFLKEINTTKVKKLPQSISIVPEAYIRTGTTQFSQRANQAIEFPQGADSELYVPYEYPKHFTCSQNFRWVTVGEQAKFSKKEGTNLYHKDILTIRKISDDTAKELGEWRKEQASLPIQTASYQADSFCTIS